MKRLLVLTASILVVFGAVTSIYAQSQEQVLNFDLRAEVEPDSGATITETIVYNFGSQQRRGIFRNIPVHYYTDEDMGYRLEINVQSVTRDGSQEQFTIENNDRDFLTLRVGDADVYIEDVHEYVIVYKTSQLAIEADDGLEIIRLDAPGTGWEVPVLEASIEVTGQLVQPVKTCYQGGVGSTTQSCDMSDSYVISNSTTLSPGETITGEFAYSSGTFSQTAELVSLAESVAGPAIFGGIVGAVIGFFGLQQIIGRLRHRARKRQEIAYPRYEPPQDLGPAELGLLIDNSSAGAELTATIIDLAVRGYIKITQVSEKGLFRKSVYKFNKTQKPNDLSGYDADLYKALFSAGSDVTTKDLAKSVPFQKAHQTFHKTLRKNLENLGFYKPVNVFRPNLANRMSDKGYEKWAEIEGFREFLSLTEKNRMEMLEAPERKPETFSQLLPYAIAFGVEEAWAKQFESLDVKIEDWYEGPTGARNMVLANQISGISSSLGQMSASAAQSSGSSGSGGGFSGGGFSGGGGGSW